MAAKKKKQGIPTYLLPILFCALLIALALTKGRETEAPVKAVAQEAEPLTLTEQAMENYLYAAGFTWTGEAVLDRDHQEAASLTVRYEADAIAGLTLRFPLPTYYETENASALTSLKARHDEAIQRGEDMFLALFDAIAATDGRVSIRRDSALDKLRQTMDTGKASTQNANRWRFSFSLETDPLSGTVTIDFTLVK